MLSTLPNTASPGPGVGRSFEPEQVDATTDDAREDAAAVAAFDAAMAEEGENIPRAQAGVLLVQEAELDALVEQYAHDWGIDRSAPEADFTVSFTDQL